VSDHGAAPKTLADTPARGVLSSAQHWSDESSFLALDLGRKSSGVAYGSLRLASPQAVGVVKHKVGFAIEPFAAFIQEWSPTALVVGVPYHPDGQAHENTRFAKRVARQLRARFGLAVLEVDERYSTTQALSEGAQPHNVDALSACVILNQFFEQLRQDAARSVVDAALEHDQASTVTPTSAAQSTGPGSSTRFLSHES